MQFFLKSIKTGEFLCSHFNIEDGRKQQHFWHLMLYYFEKGKKIQLKHTEKRFLKCLEKVKKHVKSALWGFLLNDAPQLSTPNEVDRDQIRH